MPIHVRAHRRGKEIVKSYVRSGKLHKYTFSYTTFLGKAHRSVLAKSLLSGARLLRKSGNIDSIHQVTIFDNTGKKLRTIKRKTRK